jgi:hypothetical protein
MCKEVGAKAFGVGNRTGDRLTARKTDAPAASAGYEVLYHPFNGSHTVPEARSVPNLRLVYGISSQTESRTVG